MMRTYRNGEDLREALMDGTLRAGMTIIYHGIEHVVVDAGKQGLRVAVRRKR